jgi:hypothetical protein
MLQSACNTCALSLGAIRTSSSLLRVLAALDSRTCAQRWLGLLQPTPGRDQLPRDFEWPTRTMSSAADPLLEGEHAEASTVSEVAELHRVAPLQLPSGVKKTFYKRKLPCPPATEFSSAEGAAAAAHAAQHGDGTTLSLVPHGHTRHQPVFAAVRVVTYDVSTLYTTTT